MEIIHSVLHLLLYFSLLLAPKDADRITLTGLPNGETMELTRDAGGWSLQHERVSISDGRIQVAGESIPMAIHVREAAVLAAGRDWPASPTLALDDSTTLEQTADGFMLRIKEGAGTRDHRIQYSRTAAAADITVNVLGEVKQPGVYQVPSSGSLADAIAAAGGWTDLANLKKTTIVRGPAGEVPVVTEHDVKAILAGSVASPPLVEGDTVCVPERLF